MLPPAGGVICVTEVAAGGVAEALVRLAEEPAKSRPPFLRPVIQECRVTRPGVSGDSISWESGVMGRASTNYPAELRERAVLMVAEVRAEYSSEWAAIVAVAKRLGIGSAETLRKWVRQAGIDAGNRPGVTGQESADLRKLRAEVRELRRANEILKAASVFFAAELDRPQR